MTKFHAIFVVVFAMVVCVYVCLCVCVSVCVCQQVCQQMCVHMCMDAGIDELNAFIATIFLFTGATTAIHTTTHTNHAIKFGVSYDNMIAKGFVISNTHMHK